MAPPQRRSPLAVIFLTVFLDLLGFGMVMPMLPLYAKAFHASDIEVGVLLSSYSVMQLFFAPLWGRLSDRVGRRPVLLVSIFGSCLSQLGYAITPSFVGLVVARSFAGVCGANISAAQAYVADVTDEQSRAAGMGKLGAALGLGFVFGPPLGGALALFGVRAPFFFCSALALVNFVLAFVLLEEPRRREERTASSRAVTWSALVRTLSNPRLAVLILLFFVVTFGFANLEGTFSLYLQRRFGFALPGVMYIFTYIGVTIAVVQGMMVRRLVARWGERPLVIAGTSLMAAGMLLLIFAHHLPMLLVAVAITAVGNAINNPSLSSLISRCAGMDRQGGVLGVAQSFGALARIFGPLVGNALLALGEAAPYAAAAAVIGIACVIARNWVQPAELATEPAA
jgi:multidrug resistance protein